MPMGSGSINDLIYARAADFSGASPSISNTPLLNGQLWIGSTAANAGGTNINVGSISSPLGTIAISYSSPNITIDVTGGANPIEKINVQTGTSPIVPSGGAITINGATVAAGTNPVRTDGTGANTFAIEVQTSQALAAADATKIGLANFNSAQFTVAATGFVGLIGSTTHAPILGVHPNATSGGGTDPTLADASGNISILAASVAAGTNPIRSVATAVNSITVQAQISQAIAATDATKIGLAAFDSADFTVDGNGFVSASTTGFIKTLTGSSGGAIPPTANNVNLLAAVVAAGTTPIAVAGAGSTLTINVQKSQAIAAADATKIGLSNFDSASFAVDANGFVTLAAGGVGKTITGDSGGALSPSSNNWNIFGLSGSKTSGSGSTLTIKSPPYADAGGSATSTLNSGSFVTGAFTLTLPASAGLADGDLFEYVATSAAIYVIQAVGAQKIRIGNTISSAAGTATSDGFAGTAVALRFRASDGFFYAISTIGVFVMA